jgi:hypothetical protein
MKIPSTKYQISNKISMTQIQTKDPSAIAPNGMHPGSPDFTSRYAAILAHVLVTRSAGAPATPALARRVRRVLNIEI